MICDKTCGEQTIYDLIHIKLEERFKTVFHRRPMIAYKHWFYFSATSNKTPLFNNKYICHEWTLRRFPYFSHELLLVDIWESLPWVQCLLYFPSLVLHLVCSMNGPLLRESLNHWRQIITYICSCALKSVYQYIGIYRLYFEPKCCLHWYLLQIEVDIYFTDRQR